MVRLWLQVTAASRLAMVATCFFLYSGSPGFTSSAWSRFSTASVAWQVLKTLAVTPSMTSSRNSLTTPLFTSSKRGPPLFISANSLRFTVARGSSLTVRLRGTLSLPRKSKVTAPSGLKVMCSVRRLLAPTVSASSSSFSSPTLKLSSSMR